MADITRFSKVDADRILRRAAELDGNDEARFMSVDELRSIAGEVGLGSEALDRAIAEARNAGTPGVRRPPVQKWGIIWTHLSVVREIPVDLDSDHLLRLVRLVQPYRDGPAQVELQQHEITWRDGRGLRFAVTSAGGVTEVRVFMDKLVIRRGRWRRWVKAAVDRLENLVFLVAEQQDQALPAQRRKELAAPE